MRSRRDAQHTPHRHTTLMILMLDTIGPFSLQAEQVLAMHSGISCSGDTGFALVQRLIQQPEGQAALGAFLSREDAIAAVEALRRGATHHGFVPFVHVRSIPVPCACVRLMGA